VSLTPMAALPVPTHRAAAINRSRKKITSLKVLSTVAAAAGKFAKSFKVSKERGALKQPLLHSNQSE
jgi:hypothetical protein